MIGQFVWGQSVSRRVRKANERAKTREMIHCGGARPWSAKDRLNYTRYTIAKQAVPRILGHIWLGHLDSAQALMKTMADLCQTKDIAKPFGEEAGSLLLMAAGMPHTGLKRLIKKGAKYRDYSLVSSSQSDSLQTYLVDRINADSSFLRHPVWTKTEERPDSAQVKFLQAIELNKDWLTASPRLSDSLLAMRYDTTLKVLKGAGVYFTYFREKLDYAVSNMPMAAAWLDMPSWRLAFDREKYPSHQERVALRSDKQYFSTK